jgi:hypothetical protein
MHPAGARFAAECAAAGVTGELAHAATHRLNAAPMTALWIMLTTSPSS